MNHAHAHHDSPEGLVPVEEHLRAILDRLDPLPPVDLPLREAHGCVLAFDAVAEHDLPTFPSSAMDGFAVRAADVASAAPDRPATLQVVGEARMGRRPDAEVGPGRAVRIATGAPVPDGADAVVPIEACVMEEQRVLVLEPVPEGRHVRPAGEDVREGEVLVPGGRVLSAPEMGLLASAGQGSALVHPQPRAVVISTGDELVEPGRPLEYGQVHDANAFTLLAAVRECGAVAVPGGVVGDDIEAFRDAIVSNRSRADLFVSTGGVSVGERDVVKGAFRGRSEVAFVRVAIQPGMPQAFGTIDGTPFFGLPGNPVSVFVSFEVFVRPALLRLAGRSDLSRPEVTAMLEGELQGLPAKTRFARVLVRREGDAYRAAPTGGPQSNLVATVARANGLAVIPPGTGSLGPGDPVRVMLFREAER